MPREVEGIEGLKVPTERGVLLDGVLFNGTATPAHTVLIAITGIHGNFYSNPFYINFGQTLNAGGFDFVYAQTCDAFGQIQTEDWRSGETVIIGSQTEDFNDTIDDVGAYVRWAEQNELVFIPRTGHTYQQKEQDVADVLCETITRWTRS